MRVLFIGNSHTSRNGLPCQVREMVNSLAGPAACEAAVCAADGRDLAGHAAEDGTLRALARGR